MKNKNTSKQIIDFDNLRSRIHSKNAIDSLKIIRSSTKNKFVRSSGIKQNLNLSFKVHKHDDSTIFGIANLSDLVDSHCSVLTLRSLKLAAESMKQNLKNVKILSNHDVDKNIGSLEMVKFVKIAELSRDQNGRIDYLSDNIDIAQVMSRVMLDEEVSFEELDLIEQEREANKGVTKNQTSCKEFNQSCQPKEKQKLKSNTEQKPRLKLSSDAGNLDSNSDKVSIVDIFVPTEDTDSDTTPQKKKFCVYGIVVQMKLYSDLTEGAKAINLINKGLIKDLSIGFELLEQSIENFNPTKHVVYKKIYSNLYSKHTKIKIIKVINVIEVSLVNFPANKGSKLIHIEPKKTKLISDILNKIKRWLRS